MSSVQALKLEDAEGSVMIVTRIDDIVFTISVEYAGDGPFRIDLRPNGPVPGHVEKGRLHRVWWSKADDVRLRYIVGLGF